MKKPILLFCALCALCGNAVAQQINPKIKDYPSVVVVKVYDVLKKIPLSPKEQVQLAEHCYKEDQAIANAILEGANSEHIDKLKIDYLVGFQTFLKKSGQLDNFYKSKANNQMKYAIDSVFFKAGIKNTGGPYQLYVFSHKEALKLTAQQQELLLGRMARYKDNQDDYKRSNPNGNFEVVLYNDLKNILNETQFKDYLKLKFNDRSLKLAVTKWGEMKQYGMHNKYDSTATVNKIYNFDIERLIALEHLVGDKQKQTELEKEMQKNRPREVTELYVAMRNRINSQKTAKNSFAW